MPAPNSPHLPRVNHRKPPGQKDRLPTLPGPWGHYTLSHVRQWNRIALDESLALLRISGGDDLNRRT